MFEYWKKTEAGFKNQNNYLLQHQIDETCQIKRVTTNILSL